MNLNLTMKNQIHRGKEMMKLQIGAGLLIGVSLLMTACNPIAAPDKGSSSNSSLSPDGVGSGAGTNEPPASSTLPSQSAKGPQLGVRDYQSMYTNMVAVTGINRASCQGVFDAQKDSLPEFNDLATNTGGAQAALLQVAACVCGQAISNNQNNARTTLTPGFPYTKNGSALTDDEILAGVNSILAKAWGPANLERRPAAALVNPKMLSLAKDVVTRDANANSTAASVRAMFAVCTAAFASPSAQIL